MPGIWRKAFARPDHAPMPPDNPATPDEGGARGEALRGPAPVRLRRPGLLDLPSGRSVVLRRGRPASAASTASPSTGARRRSGTSPGACPWFWDGRADSLETQAIVPIENTARDGGRSRPRRCRRSPPTRRCARPSPAPFRTIPPSPAPTSPRRSPPSSAPWSRPRPGSIRWVKGDDAALEPDELAGFRLFVGKAACVACHKGWRFTDDAFHDIGLPGDDRGPRRDPRHRGGRPCLQDAEPARAGLDRALHA